MDGQPWADGDNRAAVAGEPLGFRAAITQIMADWEAIAVQMSVPTWSSATCPCPLCNATRGNTFQFRMRFSFHMSYPR
eukprot:3728595-Pyramimonas_sp.AAC.1